MSNKLNVIPENYITQNSPYNFISHTAKKQKKYIWIFISAILVITGIIVALVCINNNKGSDISYSNVNNSPESVIDVLEEAENGNLENYEKILCPYIFEGHASDVVAHKMNDAWKEILMDEARETIEHHNDVYGEGYKAEFWNVGTVNNYRRDEYHRKALTEHDQVLEEERTYSVELVIFDKDGERYEMRNEYNIGKINGKWYLISEIN